MHGLKQIQVVSQGDSWHLVGLDEQGQVWFGTTRRTTKGRGITWSVIDEAAEDQGPPPPVEEKKGRPWPSR